MRLTYENGKVTLDDGSEVKSFLLEQPTNVEKALLSFISTLDESIGGGVEEIEELKRSIPSWVSSNEKIPSEKLPSYVDDVVEFPTESEFPEVGEEGKIYLDKSDNNIYRWSGSSYILISNGVKVGENEGQAFDGAKGKALEDKIGFMNIIEGPQNLEMYPSNVVSPKGLKSGTFYVDNGRILRQWGGENANYPMWATIAKSNYFADVKDPMGDAYGGLSMVQFIGGNCTVGDLADSSAYYIFKIKFNNDFNHETGEYTYTYYYLDVDSSGDLVVKSATGTGRRAGSPFEP